MGDVGLVAQLAEDRIDMVMVEFFSNRIFHFGNSILLKSIPLNS